MRRCALRGKQAHAHTPAGYDVKSSMLLAQASYQDYHMLCLSEMRQARVSYQDYHMLLLLAQASESFCGRWPRAWRSARHALPRTGTRPLARQEYSTVLEYIRTAWRAGSGLWACRARARCSALPPSLPSCSCSCSCSSLSSCAEPGEPGGQDYGDVRLDWKRQCLARPAASPSPNFVPGLLF